MRSAGVVLGHGPLSNAARAHCTARSTSAGPAAATCATRVSLWGEMISMRSSVLGLRQSPPMNSSS
jgi:hypothetical protein